MEKSPKGWWLVFLLTFFNWGWVARIICGDIKGALLRFFTLNVLGIFWWIDVIKLFKGTYKDGQGLVVSRK
jgi:hypothetical protein